MRAKMNTEDYLAHDDSQDPEVMEDGELPWYWWNAERMGTWTG